MAGIQTECGVCFTALLFALQNNVTLEITGRHLTLRLCVCVV